jgi:hypothetical protein
MRGGMPGRISRRALDDRPSEPQSRFPSRCASSPSPQAPPHSTHHRGGTAARERVDANEQRRASKAPRSETPSGSRPRGSSRLCIQKASGRPGPSEKENDHGQAAYQRRDHWTRRPRQDHADERPHEGDGCCARRPVALARPNRQRARGAHARHHDQPRARRVRVGGAPLRARRLSRACRLRQEHDHGRLPDGRRDSARRRLAGPSGADARARPSCAASGRRPRGRLRQQDRRRGPRAAGPRGPRGAGASAREWLRRIAGGAGLCAA